MRPGGDPAPSFTTSIEPHPWVHHHSWSVTIAIRVPGRNIPVILTVMNNHRCGATVGAVAAADRILDVKAYEA